MHRLIRRPMLASLLLTGLIGCGDKDASDPTAPADDTSAAAPDGDDTGPTEDSGGDGGDDTDGGTDGSTDDTDDTGSSGTDDTGSTVPEVNPDELLFEELLHGDADLDSVLWEVSQSGGWPIEGEDGYIFVAAGDRDPYYLAGDHNGWETAGMERAEGFWYAVVPHAELPSPGGSLYKFVDNRGDYGADPNARAYSYDEYGEYSIVRGEGGHLERWPWVGDGAVDARTLRVWVPEGPVTHQIYVHDGQNLFDPEGINGGWRLQESLGTSTMAIGLDNSGIYRIDDYTHVTDTIDGYAYGGGGDAYVDYIEGTVRPLVEGYYGAAPIQGVMGSSLGGLIALYHDLRHPAAFDFVGSLSGTVGWGSIERNNDTVIELYEAAGHGTAVLYVDSGGTGGTGCVDSDGDGIEDDARGASDNYCENVQLSDTLAGVGYVWEEDLYHWWETGASHNEAAWADRVWIPLSIFETL